MLTEKQEKWFIAMLNNLQKELIYDFNFKNDNINNFWSFNI